MMNSNRFGGSRGGKKYGARDSGEPATMHETICDECGNACQVPFKPNGKKPVFCNKCFKDSPNNYTGDRKSTMHSAICSDCGSECEVPFKPTGEKPIYCNKCFKKNSGTTTNWGSESKSKSMNMSGSKDQFEILNGKLDRIIKMLSDN